MRKQNIGFGCRLLSPMWSPNKRLCRSTTNAEKQKNTKHNTNPIGHNCRSCNNHNSWCGNNKQQ